jgi:hypothetical protein
LTIESSEDFREVCRETIRNLCLIAEYTDDGEAEMKAADIPWMFVLILSFRKAVAGDSDDDDDSDYRVDDTLF